LAIPVIPPTVTPDQIQLVRESWLVASMHADALATMFYARLFEIDADAAKLFAHTDMRAQREKLAQTLGVVVDTLDDPERFLTAVSALGKRHRRYGVEQHHFDSVGEALLGALRAALGSSYTQDVHDAWASAYALLAVVMKRALRRSRGSGELAVPSNVADPL
jgi:hemoglobin-like flavoprotein